jgi:hypothetical protein
MEALASDSARVLKHPLQAEACSTTYNGRMDISRRQLAGLFLAATASAQAPPPPTPAPATEIDDARSRQRIGAQAIARVLLPMTTEPAFQFKA